MNRSLSEKTAGQWSVRLPHPDATVPEITPSVLDRMCIYRCQLSSRCLLGQWYEDEQLGHCPQGTQSLLEGSFLWG